MCGILVDKRNVTFVINKKEKNKAFWTGSRSMERAKLKENTTSDSLQGSEMIHVLLLNTGTP